MIKKTLLVVGGLGLLTAFILGRDAWSYAKTSYAQATESVTDSFPTEFQIDRARRMVQELDPEIQKTALVIARQQVEVERLDERIAKMDGKLLKDKSEIVRLKDDLADNSSYYVYAGHRYTSNEVRQDLNNRFERFKTGETTVDHLKQMRDARRAQVDSAKLKLEEMVASKRQLEAEVENLQAQLQLVQVAEATSHISIDESKLARAKKLVGDIRTELDVAARMAAADVEYTGEIKLDGDAPADIEQQVAQYFELDNNVDVALTITTTHE